MKMSRERDSTDKIAEMIGEESLSVILSGVAIWCETGSDYMGTCLYGKTLNKIAKLIREAEKISDDYYEDLKTLGIRINK